MSAAKARIAGWAFSELGAKLGISAMPTFKVFKAKKEVGEQRGWSEKAVRTLLEAKRAKKGGKKGE